MDLLPLAALLVGGLVAGVVNAMAGGGSLITLPLLVFAGLDPTVANGTNRVAVVVQSVTAVYGFHEGGHLPWRATFALAPATLVGAGLGAWIASGIPDDLFRPILGGVLLVMAGFVLVKPQRWLHPKKDPRRRPSVAMHATMFAVGLYGGFIQAGLGFLMLGALVLGQGFDLVRANGIKVALALLLTGVALAVFIAAGQVAWLHGGVLAVGNGVGGYLGARLAIAKGAPWIRWVLVVMVVASALEILGVREALFGALGL